MTVINFSGTAVSDIAFLGSFEKMWAISANNTALKGDLDFSGFAELNHLELDGNKITSLNLSQCRNLESLRVNNNELSDLNGLTDCIKLKEIYAGHNKITDLSGLTNATILQNVFLNGNKLKDISVLSKSAATLERVYISDNEISECFSMSQSLALAYFVADNNKLAELEFLNGNTSLRGISVKGNAIASAAAIKQCANLTYADLSDNRLTDVDFLAEMNFMSEFGVAINLSNNEIKSVNLPHFKCKYLSLAGDPIESVSGIENVIDGKVILNYADSIDFEAISKSGISSVKLIGVPLDKQVALENKGIEFISSEAAAESFKTYMSDIEWGENES